MFRITISDHQRGVLVRDGKLSRFLEPGRHKFFSWGAELSAIVFDLEDGYTPLSHELSRVLPPAAFDELVVERGELAMLSVDGLPKAVLVPGRYALWRVRGEPSVLVVSTADVISSVPRAFWKHAPASHVTQVAVQPYERGLVLVDGKVDRVLEPGSYALSTDDRTVIVVRVDLRERELQIAGQEVMTLDKVSLRVNVAARWKVVDPELSHVATSDLASALYTEVQMVVRRLVAGRTVDALLADRMTAAAAMLGEIAERVRTWGAEVTAVDVKDVVLPGEMRVLMNKVVEATKQAEASVILRREEVAATRSLANTAKMLAESPTLMRLKELEVLRDVADRVGKVTVVASGDKLLGALKIDTGE